MGLLAWIIFGALAGWVASMVAGTNRQQGCLSDIIVGVVGAFIGGLGYRLITGGGFNFEFDLTSFVVAVLGALVLLGLLRFARGRA
jgi:uncharacterized membrane protein YeaQ/YmgE (transglycosylase-associated protein family)